MPRFEGKVAIVTGSSSGIGAATARLFAREGAKVTLTSNRPDDLEATKRSIIDAGGKEENIHVVVADITDASGREKIVSSTAEKWGRIDILVNNAGGFVLDEKGANTISASVDNLRKTMELNTYSSVHMIQLARPYLAKTKGEIVNVSSIGGQPKGTPRWIYYAMAKGALDQLTRGLAVELISEGIRVNSISPGTTETNFCITAGMPEGSKEKLTEMSESSPDILPIRKVAQPEEMASIIAFLADRRRSRYIIGQTIVADGGALLVLAANASVDFLEK